MLALFKGAGRLPELIIEQLAAAGTAPVVCALDPDDEAQFHVSLPRLGSLLGILRSRGVTEICMAGSIDRTTLTLGAPDAATQPLVPALQAALGGGDGQALAGLHKLLEDQGFQIRAAQELCPELLPPEGVLTQAKPTKSHEQDTAKAGATLAITGAADLGQGCVVEDGQVVAVECLPGTDAMLASVAAFRAGQGWSQGGVFMKAPKPGQDLRTDMPTIGPETAQSVVDAGLAGIVIEAGGVMVLDLDDVIQSLNAAGAFLWVRAR